MVHTASSKQLAFKELFVGTLIYMAVLGLFNDYTSIFSAISFSYIFLASIVLEILTFLTFQLKDKIVAWLKPKKGTIYRILMFFSVWFVMFMSKFVFVWAIDSVFGNNVTVYELYGIFAIVVCVTLLHKAADYAYAKLQ